jgi:putative restriction endonuclease
LNSLLVDGYPERMAKAVFMTKVQPGYNDLPEQRYHFGSEYLDRAQAAVGDWIVYYEPRRPPTDLMSRGGRQAYFATAKVDRIIPDLEKADHFYAEVSGYLEFSRAVPFAEGGIYYESGLQKPDGSTNRGRFGHSVRVIPDEEFDRIWRAGFGHVLGLEARHREGPDAPEEPLAPDDGEEPFEVDRPIVDQMVSRPFRRRAFSANLKSAYSDTCAITRLRIINGRGRSEVQGAHIRPVEERGPDSVRNGLALSGTVHWMFDRGLISIEDDYTLLVAESLLPDTVSRLIPPERRLLLPKRTDLWPHRQFLAYHREKKFKG